MKLELSGMERGGTTLHGVTVEGALERWRESARVTLMQERVRDGGFVGMEEEEGWW